MEHSGASFRKHLLFICQPGSSEVGGAVWPTLATSVWPTVKTLLVRPNAKKLNTSSLKCSALCSSLQPISEQLGCAHEAVLTAVPGLRVLYQVPSIDPSAFVVVERVLDIMLHLTVRTEYWSLPSEQLHFWRCRRKLRLDCLVILSHSLARFPPWTSV